jgi:adenosylhomocysteine nucleosidase
VGAFDEEIILLQSKVKNPKNIQIQGIPFVTGTLGGRRVVIGLTGIGKVNAAMTTTLLIEHFRPSQVLFTGVAGGLNPTLLPGDIVIARQTAQHDYGRLIGDTLSYRGTRNPFDKTENPVFFAADSMLFTKAMQAGKQVQLEQTRLVTGNRTPVIISGTVVTGDIFVASSAKKNVLIQDFGADATEMEGAAVAQICWQFKTPCLVIRSLSDSADENAATDIREFYRIAARNSANLVVHILEILSVK